MVEDAHCFHVVGRLRVAVHLGSFLVWDITVNLNILKFLLQLTAFALLYAFHLDVVLAKL